jgi:hypothetical protein
MKTFNYWWKFSGLREYHERGTVQARNLPQALDFIAQKEGFCLSGRSLKRHGKRRLHFWGRSDETGLVKTSAPLVEGVVANS